MIFQLNADLVRHLEQLSGGETVRRDYLRVRAPVERPRFVTTCPCEHNRLNPEKLAFNIWPSNENIMNSRHFS